jgi:hypothetical protein
LIDFGMLVLEKIFKNFSVFLLVYYYLLLEKGYPLHLNKLESPPSKDDLCQVWLNLGKCFFWRGPGPLFAQTWIPFIQE